MSAPGTLTTLLCLVSLAQAHATLYVPSFTKYPGYDGSLEVAGQVSIVSEGTGTTAKQTLTWSLRGLDVACTAGAAGAVTNGCGIHVHTGTSCAVAGDVGGHYYNDSQLSDDPWLPVVYVATAQGTSDHNAGVDVTTGLLGEDINGRVLVVHKLDSGARIACGVIGADAGSGQVLEVATFATYPEYTGGLEVAGTVTIAGADGTDTTAKQTLTWNLRGLDVACTAGAADNVQNGCGIHVHTGTSCDVANNVGGHYYSAALQAAGAADPWNPVVYVAAADGSAEESSGVEVVTGLSNGDIMGRVVVVHQLASGGRVACGVIRPEADASVVDAAIRAVAGGRSLAYACLLCMLAWASAE